MKRCMISIRILFTLTFTLGLVLAGPARAIMRKDPVRPPPGSTVLQEGVTVQLKGRLVTGAINGRGVGSVVLSAIEGSVYERIALRYPSFTPPTGVPRRPRPAFQYRKVEALDLVSRGGLDLLSLANLIGTATPVEVDGTFRYFRNLGVSTGLGHGLEVTSIKIDGWEVPADVTSIDRLIVSAKLAARREILADPDNEFVRFVHEEAQHLGGFLVRVTTTFDPRAGRTGNPELTVRRFTFDGLTGELYHDSEVLPFGN